MASAQPHRGLERQHRADRGDWQIRGRDAGRGAGSEQIEVPAGRFEARHLKATAADGSLVLDIWYAFERRNVPVRIRMQDSKGEVLDQRARSIVIDGAETASRMNNRPRRMSCSPWPEGCTGR